MINNKDHRAPETLTFKHDDRVELGFIIRSRGDSHVKDILTVIKNALHDKRTVTVTIND